MGTGRLQHIQNKTFYLTMKQSRTTGEEERTANTRFASIGVTCLHSSSVFQLGFSGRLTVLCSENPHERKAWERWLTTINPQWLCGLEKVPLRGI